jgi:predicted site-specific integrase-resolvase
MFLTYARVSSPDPKFHLINHCAKCLKIYSIITGDLLNDIILGRGLYPRHSLVVTLAAFY